MKYHLNSTAKQKIKEVKITITIKYFSGKVSQRDTSYSIYYALRRVSEPADR